MKMKPTKKQVIVMGKGSLAVKIANWFLKSTEYDLVLVIPNMPESSWTVSLKDWAQEKTSHLLKQVTSKTSQMLTMIIGKSTLRFQ